MTQNTFVVLVDNLRDEVGETVLILKKESTVT